MRKMQLLFGLLFFTMSLSLLASPIKTLTLDMRDVTIETFLDEVKKQTGVNFLYSANLLQENDKVTVKAVNEFWDVVLTKVLDSHGLTYKVENNVVVIRKKEKPLQHPVGTIIGRVFDEKGDALAGANIIVRYTDKGDLFITANDKGAFSLTTHGDEESLTASFVGYLTTTLRIKSDKKYYGFNLKEGHQLNDVVVTGIFNKPKVSFTGAATIISSDDIKRMGNRNLLKTLSNIDPSFDIQENNTKGSDPNQTLSIEIRGSSSITSVNNLKQGILNQNEMNMPLFILDGFEVTSDRVKDMNQSDVESVVILKDASATAIYGSRGANGVVVITSKKPDLGKLRVSYSMGFNLEIPDLSSYHLMNSSQKLEAEKDAGLYTSTSLTTQLELTELYNEHLKAAEEGVNTNWLKIPIRTGMGQYHKLDFSGGTDQFRYILNLSYNQLNGAMKGSNRNNINGNMTISYLLKKVRFTNDLSLGFNNSSQGSYGSFSDWALMNPYWKPYQSDGVTPVTSYQVFANSTQRYSPLYDAVQTTFKKGDYTNIRNTTMLDMDVLPGLRVNFSLGFTQQSGEENDFDSPKESSFIQQNFDAASAGTYVQTINKQNSFQLSGTASWAKIFGKHTIYLGLNSQMIQTKVNENIVEVEGFMNDQMNDISDGNTYYGEKPTTTETTVRTLGFTGTFNYNFDERYFLDASFREDAASSFGSANRWAPFWSVGAGWEMANEKWMKKVLPFISHAKWRYSYGSTSTLNFTPYEAMTTYEYNTSTQYDYLIGATISGYGNPHLKWQQTLENNLGLDLVIAKRFSITSDVYRKMTSNLLSDAYLSYSHGYTSYKENLGKVRNTGFDLYLGFDLLKNTEHDFDWTLHAGLYHNSNVLVKLSDAIKKAEENNTEYSSSTSYYKYVEGQSIDEIYVLHSIGIDPESGKRLYVNTDGTVTSNVSGLKEIPVGNSQPKIDGRFGTTIHWKGLMADFSFGCRWGGKKLNQTLLDNVENAYVQNNCDVRVLSGRWKKAGDIAQYKNIASTDATYANDCFVFTEKTLTLDNVNVSYDFPTQWIRKFSMHRLSLTASLADVFYISNIKQERGLTYPYSIKPMFSVACTF